MAIFAAWGAPDTTDRPSIAVLSETEDVASVTARAARTAYHPQALVEFKPGGRRVRTRLTLSTRRRTWAAAAVLSVLVGSLLLAGGERDYEVWPMPEAFTRGGGGRLAELIPGDWEVICHASDYAVVSEEVKRNLEKAHLPRALSREVPDTYFGENKFPLVLLSSKHPPRVALIQRNNIGFDFWGPKCHRRERAVYTVVITETPYGTYARIIFSDEDAASSPSSPPARATNAE